MKNSSFILFTIWIVLNFIMYGCAGRHKMAAMQTPQTLEEWAHHLFDTSGVHSGLYMVEIGDDIADDNPLLDYHSQSLFTPASNTKLLTFYGALKFLPDRLTGLKYRNANGKTYFKGTGDPGFLDSRFDSESVLSFFKDQDSLIFVSDWNADQRWGNGWSWDDYPYYYAAQRSPFMIYGNVVKAWCRDGKWHMAPSAFIQNIVSQPLSLSVKREEEVNIFQLNEAKCVEDTLHIPYVWNPEVFTQLLADTIHRPVDWIRALPSDRQENWESVAGSGRDTLLRAMLYESDNLIAEQMLWNISSALWDTISTSHVIDSLMNADFNNWKGKIRWVDGSGLSVYNKFSPRFFVELLRKLYKLMPRDELFQFLAAGGVRGTIASWYGNKTTPYVYAKTGTLSGVHCLSGYLIADSGKTYAFSFMHNNFLGSSSQYKLKMQQLMEWIRENY